MGAVRVLCRWVKQKSLQWKMDLYTRRTAGVEGLLLQWAFDRKRRVPAQRPSSAALGFAEKTLRALAIKRDMWHRMKKDNTPGLSANCVEEILEGLQFNYTLLDSTYRALLRKAPKRNRYAESLAFEETRHPLQALAEEVRLPLALGVLGTPLTFCWIISKILLYRHEQERHCAPHMEKLV
ncbi:hypothetical protein QR680_012989 [Steinernema hermaphroditum]|uniref:Uncharacterized protein n=1 Tax=Steinernema hermaphroditum TaxID=289476 RepID=A0AA39I5F4_9BILA|nr:hypothetical protein QR680_012989 [Steinernema hermaphroditum]